MPWLVTIVLRNRKNKYERKEDCIILDDNDEPERWIREFKKHNEALFNNVYELDIKYQRCAGF